MMKNQLGLTLIEILVVLGILSASFLVSAEVLNQMNKSVRHPEAQVNLGGLSTVIRETLRFNSICQQAFSPMTGVTRDSVIANQNITLRLPGILADGTPGDDVLTIGSRAQGLVIERLRFVNAVSIETTPDKIFAQVELGARVASTGLALKPYISGGFFFKVAGGVIQSCESSGDDPVPLCQEMGCTWNPAVTPSCNCQPVDLTCPPQQFLTGVDGSGKPICTPLGSGVCPPGEYLRGVSIGANDCVPLSSIIDLPSATMLARAKIEPARECTL